MSQIFNVTFENNRIFDPGVTGTAFDIVYIEGGTVAVNSASAHDGSYGCEITPRAYHMSYGSKGTPNCWMTKFRQSFWFDPNSISFGTGNYITICRNGHGDLSQMMYVVWMTWNGSTYRLQAGLSDNNLYPTNFTSEVSITDTWHLIELYWQRGTPGSLQFWIDDTSYGTPSVNNDQCWVNNPCLGQGRFPSFTISGSYRFDTWRANDDGSYIGGT